MTCVTPMAFLNQRERNFGQQSKSQVAKNPEKVSQKEKEKKKKEPE